MSVRSYLNDKTVSRRSGIIIIALASELISIHPKCDTEIHDLVKHSAVINDTTQHRFILRDISISHRYFPMQPPTNTNRQTSI